jgi:hypothetical protein
MSRIMPSPQPTERASLATAAPIARSEPPVRPVIYEPPAVKESVNSVAAALANLNNPTPPAAPAREEPQSEPLPPPATPPSDPYRIRAEAVGLHPDLSRVLLDRLSETDYRNAGIAIRTALAETPDSGEYVWPRQRKPDLALFRVRFVQGAAPSLIAAAQRPRVQAAPHQQARITPQPAACGRTTAAPSRAARPV